jgi:hypothetical protein
MPQGKGALSIYWIGPIANLDVVTKRKKFLPCSCQESHPVVQPITYSLYLLSYPASQDLDLNANFEDCNPLEA